MLHDSHISSTDSDVARDAVPETVSMDSAIVEPPDAEFPDVWGEGTNNPWQNWQPNGNAGSVSGVGDDGVIDLELVASEDEFDSAGRRRGPRERRGGSGRALRARWCSTSWNAA